MGPNSFVSVSTSYYTYMWGCNMQEWKATFPRTLNEILVLDLCMFPIAVKTDFPEGQIKLTKY